MREGGQQENKRKTQALRAQRTAGGQEEGQRRNTVEARGQLSVSFGTVGTMHCVNYQIVVSLGSERPGALALVTCLPSYDIPPQPLQVQTYANSGTTTNCLTPVFAQSCLWRGGFASANTTKTKMFRKVRNKKPCQPPCRAFLPDHNASALAMASPSGNRHTWNILRFWA